MERLTDQIEALVRSSMKAGTIGGAVILVERSGETVVHHGIGRAEFDSSFELKPDGIFGMMSMTKPVTAASALILNSEGKLELEASVSRYIPEFAKPRRVRTLKPGESYPPFPPLPGAPTPPEPAYDYAPAQREITVRDLLTFTSGLQTIGVPNGAPQILPEDTLASFVAKLDSVPLEFQPGSQWHYSNATGYDVLGRVIEVASGKSFQDFARERLFAPLEMEETQFGINPELKGRIVPLGFLAGEAISRQDYPSGSAGLFSTAKDYAKFARMLLDDGIFKGRQVMKPEAAKAMHRRQIGDIPFEGIRVSEYARPIHRRKSPFTYGYGVGLLAEPSPDESLPVGSYGWDGIGTRRFWVIPSERVVLIMLMSGIGLGAEPVHKAIEACVVRWAAAN